MTDIVALSSLSDEPGLGKWGADFSPRLVAVLDRLPQNSVRISNALLSANVLTVSTLQAMTPHDLLRMKNFGSKYIKDLRHALAYFGLSISLDPVVVPDDASIADAQVQRLQDWIAERMAVKTSLTEREVLRDVMLVLDGRTPTNRREWSSAESDEHTLTAPR